MARVIQVFKDDNGYVRNKKLRIGKPRNSDEGNSILERSVLKIVLLIVFLVSYKETRISKTNGVQLQVMNIYLRLKIYLKTLVGS